WTVRNCPDTSAVPRRRTVLALAAVLAAGAVVSVAALLGGVGGRPVVHGAWAEPGGSGAAPGTVDGSASPSASAAAKSSPSTPPPASGTPPGWRLMWSPQAGRDGLAAFEGVEDDRAGTDPGVKHIYVQGDNYRVDMPMNERDSAPDRQRNEVKGMHADGKDLSLGLGETWRLDWSFYIPDSLQGTNRFTHIMQPKM